MTNIVSNEHFLENKKSDYKVQIDSTSGLNLELSVLHNRMMNPTILYMQVNEIVDQDQGGRAKKKESKWRKYLITGNISSYSIILNSEHNIEMVQDYNELDFSIAMLNAEKEDKSKAQSKKNVG